MHADIQYPCARRRHRLAAASADPALGQATTSADNAWLEQIALPVPQMLLPKISAALPFISQWRSLMFVAATSSLLTYASMGGRLAGGKETCDLLPAVNGQFIVFDPRLDFLRFEIDDIHIF